MNTIAATPSPPPPPRSRRVLLGLIVVLAWASWGMTFWRHAVHNPILRDGAWGVDYDKHWEGSVYIVEGRNPYTAEFYFAYPQLTAWSHIFLAAFSRAEGEIVWDVWNAILIFLSLVLLIKMCRPEAAPHVDPPSPRDPLHPEARRWIVRQWPAMAALAFVLYAPVYLDLTVGNVEPMNVILLAALTGVLLRGRENTAGLVLAAVCLVKVLPLLFLPALWLGGRRRVVGVCFVAFAVYAAILLGSEVFRPGEGWWRWEIYLYREILPELAFRFRGISASLVEILARYPYPALGESKAAYDLVSRAIAVGISTAYLAVLWFARGRPGPAWRDNLGLASMTVVIVSPLVEGHHFVWALPAYVLLIVDYVEGRCGSRWFLPMFFGWMVLFACRWWVDVGQVGRVHPYEISTLLLMVLWGVTAVRMIMLARRSPMAGPEPDGRAGVMGFIP